MNGQQGLADLITAHIRCLVKGCYMVFSGSPSFIYRGRTGQRGYSSRLRASFYMSIHAIFVSVFVLFCTLFFVLLWSVLFFVWVSCVICLLKTKPFIPVHFTEQLT